MFYIYDLLIVFIFLIQSFLAKGAFMQFSSLSFTPLRRLNRRALQRFCVVLLMTASTQSFAVVVKDDQEEPQAASCTQTAALNVSVPESAASQPVWPVPVGDVGTMQLTEQGHFFWKGESLLRGFTGNIMMDDKEPKAFTLPLSWAIDCHGFLQPQERFEAFSQVLKATWDRRAEWKEAPGLADLAKKTTPQILRHLSQSEDVLPKPTFPTRDGETTWFETNAQPRTGYTLNPVEEVKNSVFVRVYDRPFTLVDPQQEPYLEDQTFYLVEIFLKGMVCLGHDEVKSAGAGFEPSAEPFDKRQRMITHRGKVQHPCGWLTASLGALISDAGEAFILEGADEKDSGYTFLQGMPKAYNNGLFVHNASFNTLEQSTVCPLRLASGLRFFTAHDGLVQESTAEGLRQNVERETEKALDVAARETNRAAAEAARGTERAAKEVGRGMRRLFKRF